MTHILEYAEQSEMIISKSDRIMLKDYVLPTNLFFVNEASIRDAIDSMHRSEYVRKHHHFFEDYQSNTDYKEKLKPFFISLGENGEITGIDFRTTSGQSLTLNEAKIKKVDHVLRFKAAHQTNWVMASFKVKSMSDDGYDILTSSLDINLKIDDKIWNPLQEVINKKIVQITLSDIE